jgi:hypothetical protein
LLIWNSPREKRYRSWLQTFGCAFGSFFGHKIHVIFFVLKIHIPSLQKFKCLKILWWTPHLASQVIEVNIGKMVLNNLHPHFRYYKALMSEIMLFRFKAFEFTYI